MKWFKHETDAHKNLKLRAVIDTLGMAAYGYYWACVELVADQGTDFCLGREKEWQMSLKKSLNVEIELQKDWLIFFAKKKLIDGPMLRKGKLYIPKLQERQDEYTEKKKRKVSGHNPDNVPLEQNRTDKNRREQTKESLKNDQQSPRPGSPPVAISETMKSIRERLQADGILKK